MRRSLQPAVSLLCLVTSATHPWSMPQGALGDVRVYRGALGAPEVAALYQTAASASA